VKPALVVLLAVTTTLTIVVALARRWRLPQQPRLALDWRRGARRQHSPRAETAFEVAVVAGACVALPGALVGLLLLLLSRLD
jgi:hypothetical protein